MIYGHPSELLFIKVYIYNLAISICGITISYIVTVLCVDKVY